MSEQRVRKIRRKQDEAELKEAAVQIKLARKLQRSLFGAPITDTLARGLRRTTLRSTSVHEAGHATVALASGGYVWGAIA